MDMQSIRFSAEERVKRGQCVTLFQALFQVMGDCLLLNDDPGHKPAGVFLDWNWYRLDCYKAAKGLPVGVPVRDILARRSQRKLAA